MDDNCLPYALSEFYKMYGRKMMASPKNYYNVKIDDDWHILCNIGGEPVTEKIKSQTIHIRPGATAILHRNSLVGYLYPNGGKMFIPSDDYTEADFCTSMHNFLSGFSGKRMLFER